MKENKGVNVTRRSIKHDFQRAYVFDASRKVRTLVANCEVRRCDDGIQDIGCQVDARKDVLCTCRAKSSKQYETRYFSNISEQIYAYHGVRSYTNIGVGNLKTIQRRNVTKIYLPEMDDRGVGSSDVSSVKIRKPTYMAEDYVPKKMSSKCVGGSLQPTEDAECEKLSPIVKCVKCVCASTGSEMPGQNNVEIGNNTERKKFASTTTQVESTDKVKPPGRTDPPPTEPTKPTDKTRMSPRTKAYLARKAREEEKFSSDSLVQHVHDLECTPSGSQDKPSKASLDPMENKMEQEYRHMFSSNSSNQNKPCQPSPAKSTSMLRRRFQALRRGLKKDDKKNEVDTASSSPASVVSRKDVSVVSDPPSLEARSYYDDKSPALVKAESPKYDRVPYGQTVTNKKDSFNSTEDDENEFEQGVAGMFKFWGKKFNFEDDTRMHAKHSSDTSKDQDVDKIGNIDSKDTQKKSGGRKFSFFKRRSRDTAKSEKPYKTKKGVTANRCEVKTGLAVKIRSNSKAYNTIPPTSKAVNKVSTGKIEDMQRKTWLKKYLTSQFDSKESVKIRWNNKTYATSSSTVFELMDNFYRETGIVIRSKSDIQTNKKPYKPPDKKTNFVKQHIQAWMIPRTITDVPTFIPMKISSTADKGDTTYIEVGISEQKRSIDKAKTFNKIELVLRSDDTAQEDDNKSSDFLRIDIPNDFFSESCGEETRGTSDEKVYKIVEYEAIKSSSVVKKNLDPCGHKANEISVTVSVKDSQYVEPKVLETVIKSPPMHRDVVIQGSNVGLPKRCDVIGVGILTQRDVREMKPILKIQEDFTEEESETPYNPEKHCEFAQSYLQDYYRQCMPLGMDPSSCCVSDSGVQENSERNSVITLNQGDGSKSCPNMCEHYQPSTVISPSHSHNFFDEEYRNRLFYKVTSQNTKKTKESVSKDKDGEAKKTGAKKADEADPKKNTDMRVLPKDSVEVFKKRRTYACSNKSKWFSGSPDAGPYSVPSLTDRGAPDCPKPCFVPQKKQKSCKKHVSMGSCEKPQEESACSKSLEGILSFKGSTGCGTCKKAAGTGKTLKMGSSCEIPKQVDPLCKEKCEKNKTPPCDKNTTPCPSPPLALSKSSSVLSMLSGCSDKCSTVKPKECPPAPPPSVNPKTESCVCSPKTSPLHDCPMKTEDKGKKMKMKEKKLVKCHTPPCADPPPPKCGACVTPPCSNSQETCPPSEPPCPIPGPPALAKKRNKCQKNCSYKSKSEVGVDPCTTPDTHQDSCFPPPPPASGQCPTRICSPKSVPPCPSPKQPCPAQAKLPKAIAKSMPSFHQRPIDSGTLPKPPCLPTSVPTIPPCPDPKPDPCPGFNSSRSPPKPLECPRSCRNRKPKINGLFLKKFPSKKKTCADDCSSWDDVDNCEHMNIRIKERTPSTEEIREIKIKDEDGRTMCERTEYRKKQQNRSIHRPAVLGDMYNRSFCQRVSTKSAQIVRSTVEKNNMVPKVSSKSLDNLVDIQFTMRVTQGDKTTEINIGNDGGVEEKKVIPESCSREVYVVNNQACPSSGLPEREASNDMKNDINIHIVIKNFKRKDKKQTTGDKYLPNQAIGNFANNISEKFHTVSTAYSDIFHSDFNQNEASHAFSIHRATWDLTGSDEKSKTQPSGDVSDFTDKEIKKITTSQSVTSITLSATKFDTTTEEKSSWSEKIGDIKSETEKEEDKENETDKETDKEIYKADEIDVNPTTDETDLDIGIEVTHSTEEACSDNTKPCLTPRNKKKKMLKMVIEKAGKIKHKNKEKVSKITRMLKAIMTTSESSGNADMTVPDNELAKDIIKSSLKPGAFRYTDSMNNFYQMSLTSDNDDLNCVKESDNSDASSNGDKCGVSCLCRTVAAKLNVLGQEGCCCRSPVKTYVDIDTNCNIGTDEDMSYVLNYSPSEYVDEGTQRSRLFFSKANSANFSINNFSVKDLLSNIMNVTESKMKPGNDFTTHTIAKALSLKISAHPAQIEINKECDIRKFSKDTLLNTSDDDNIIVANMEPKRRVKEVKEVIAHMEPVRIKVETTGSAEESGCKEESDKSITPADILQSYETKKAVLEIYTERTICNGKKHLVAKLPKFTIERESEIIKYEKICTRSIVMSFES